MGLVVSLGILFPFVFTVHGVVPPEDMWSSFFGRNGEMCHSAKPPGQATHSDNNFIFFKKLAPFCLFLYSRTTACNVVVNILYDTVVAHRMKGFKVF